MVRRRHWFKLWVTESYSTRQLCHQSGYSAATLNRIKSYWLGQIPEDNIDYSRVERVIYDATYFHKDGCLLNLMNSANQQIIAHIYVKKESFNDVYPWLLELRDRGLDPVFITTDGERSVMHAMRLVWPQAKLQRCLYHIQHEGMRWLRAYPKTEAGKYLKDILSRLSSIKAQEQSKAFIDEYNHWLNTYKDFVLSLPRSVIAYKDLKKTITLINNALPDMFHYLSNEGVHETTNALEGFHSKLKSDYRRHCGLSKPHRISYINWYCHFKNEKISNTK